ncbi:hypothetical protein BKA67DRAFT_139244 [Truncatella angustata]|uniref:Uncharacterized protein n=1 Tax=Truncatella angustata TaxID=152316 RepID=A0A9P8UBI7_9PEZI|nr:uncharacterized protein BKA67DRAFT_139244 [Truncatella angustata]KAH6640012.1 hypothetical protein BKA67DRAFT_139244 [Truncatella angustata]
MWGGFATEKQFILDRSSNHPISKAPKWILHPQSHSGPRSLTILHTLAFSHCPVAYSRLPTTQTRTRGSRPDQTRPDARRQTHCTCTCTAPIRAWGSILPFFFLLPGFPTLGVCYPPFRPLLPIKPLHCYYCSLCFWRPLRATVARFLFILFPPSPKETLEGATVSSPAPAPAPTGLTWSFGFSAQCLSAASSQHRQCARRAAQLRNTTHNSTSGSTSRANLRCEAQDREGQETQPVLTFTPKTERERERVTHTTHTHTTTPSSCAHRISSTNFASQKPHDLLTHYFAFFASYPAILAL